MGGWYARVVSHAGTAVEAVGAAAVAVLPGGTPVAVGASAAVPVVARIAERLSRRGGEQASVALVAASEFAGLTAEQAEARISDDPSLLRLAAAALSAAARAGSEEKVYLLARLLADGLAGATDTSVLQIRAAALDDLEGPHVQMLALATSERPDRTDGQTGLTRGELSEADPVLAPVLDAVIATLFRHGLIVDITTGNFLGSGYDTQRWGLSPLGDEILRDLHAAAHAIRAES